MGTLSTYFKPEPHQPLIEDKGKRERLFKYWRWRILYTTFIGYAVYYFTRGTLPLVLPELKNMGYDEVYLGWMLTAFQLFYGVSKFTNGVWADKANPRYFMAIGLMMTGVVSIFFGLSMSIWAFMIFWTLNGWFQGCGSAPCHKLLTHWYRTSERGRWWSVWNTSHNVGAALLPILGVVLLSNWGWQALCLFQQLSRSLLASFLSIA